MAFVPGTAPAQSSGKVLTSQVANVVFTELEKQIMEEYFGVRRRGSYEERNERTYERGDDRRDDRRKSKKSKKFKNKGKKGKNRGLPPGLAKKKQLPPGLARQLERKGTSPPGLAKRDLPKRLNATLPDPWPGTERKIVDNNVVLLQKGTDLILDVLRDVVLR